MPTRQKSTGTDFTQIFHPINYETSQMFNKHIFDAYNRTQPGNKTIFKYPYDYSKKLSINSIRVFATGCRDSNIKGIVSLVLNNNLVIRDVVVIQDGNVFSVELPRKKDLNSDGLSELVYFTDPVFKDELTHAVLSEPEVQNRILILKNH